MKIRYYKDIDGFRWIGFLLAMASAFILSGGDAHLQWAGWGIALVSCSIWVYIGYQDRVFNISNTWSLELDWSIK